MASVQSIIDDIDRTDMLLLSMTGLMEIVQDYAERNLGPGGLNQGAQLAIVMQTLIEDVRAKLSEVAQGVLLKMK